MSDEDDIALVLAELDDESIPPERLKELVRSGSDAVKAAIAAHPSAPREALLALVDRYPTQVLTNPVWALMFLAEPSLYARLPRSALQAIAGCAACPRSFLVWIFEHRGSDHEKWLYEALATNTHLDEETRLKALFHLPWYLSVQYDFWLSRNPGLLPSLPEGERLFGNMFGTRGRWRPDEADMLRMLSLGPLGCRWLSEHKRTPPALLSRLYTHEDRWIRLYVAKHANTPAEALQQLVHDEDDEVVEAACQHASTPISVLTRALDDGALSRRMYGLLKRDDVETSDLIRVLEQPIRELWYMALQHPGMPAEILSRFAQREDLPLRLAVSKNPTAPVEILERLAAMDEESIHKNLAANPSTPERVLIGFAQSGPRLLRRIMAHMPHTPRTVLSMLVTDESEMVRKALASERHMPGPLLDLLSTDEVEGVREKVAGNVSTPPETLRRLTSDPAEKVARRARKNRNTPR